MSIKWINFKDSDSDQHAYKIEHINAIFITAATTIQVHVRNADNPGGSAPSSFEGSIPAGISDDIITITVTAGKAESILRRKLLRPIASKSTRPIHISSNISGITTVAHAAGT